MARKKKKPAGLGDVIAEVTSAVGIKPCDNCEKRKDIFNVAWPFHKPKSLTEEQTALIQTELTDSQYIDLYNELFTANIRQDCLPNVLNAIKKKIYRLKNN